CKVQGSFVLWTRYCVLGTRFSEAQTILINVARPGRTPPSLAFLSRSPSGREKTGRRGGIFGAIRSSRTFRGPIEKRDDAAAGDGDSRRRLTSRRPDLR